MKKFLEQFYNAFASIFPEEDDYKLSLLILQDLVRSSSESIQLAACMALGNFVQMNYIYDLTEEQCRILSRKALLCCNSTHVGAEQSSKELLLFLLSDPRAKRPENQYKLLLEPDVLRADLSGHYPLITSSDPSIDDYTKFYDAMQSHISSVYDTPEFIQAEEEWSQWHSGVAEKRIRIYTTAIVKEELKLEETKKVNTKVLLAKLNTEKLFVTFEEEPKVKKGLYANTVSKSDTNPFHEYRKEEKERKIGDSFL